MPLGTVIATRDSPTTRLLHVVLSDDSLDVSRGEIIEIATKDVPRHVSVVLGMIKEIHKTNAYFSSADVAKDYSVSSPSVTSLFPVDEWAATILTVQPFGVYSRGKISKLLNPASPGSTAFKARSDVVRDFFGLEKTGLFMGSTKSGEPVPVKLSMTRLLRKHLAILAISGAGKSYAISILIEEILKRNKEQGRIGIVAIDPHGEFNEFENSDLDVEVIKGSFITIDVKKVTAWMIAEFEPNISPIQTRELDKIIRNLRKSGFNSFDDIISEVASSESMGSRTKEALLGWLYKIQKLNIFSTAENPPLLSTVKPGKLLVFDFSDILNIRLKQIYCAYISRQLFNARRNGKIAPFLLIIEEAHQFCPEGGSSVSKTVIETIAREGRKFYSSLCLISQRPVRLSTTALSQCNSQLILRIRNPYDLDYIGRSAEGIDRDMLNVLPDLDIGEGLIVGNAVNYPLLFQVRKREVDLTRYERSMEEEARLFDR
ncbi:MAG: ATP-binding protein [Candidatus Hodarchaeales archaeon]|jgi:DNA helicase HerA-like ATPase